MNILVLQLHVVTRKFSTVTKTILRDEPTFCSSVKIEHFRSFFSLLVFFREIINCFVSKVIVSVRVYFYFRT